VEKAFGKIREPGTTVKITRVFLFLFFIQAMTWAETDSQFASIATVRKTRVLPGGRWAAWTSKASRAGFGPRRGMGTEMLPTELMKEMPFTKAVCPTGVYDIAFEIDERGWPMRITSGTAHDGEECLLTPPSFWTERTFLPKKIMGLHCTPEEQKAIKQILDTAELAQCTPVGSLKDQSIVAISLKKKPSMGQFCLVKDEQTVSCTDFMKIEGISEDTLRTFAPWKLYFGFDHKGLIEPYISIHKADVVNYLLLTPQGKKLKILFTDLVELQSIH
jgi:hypothetical protein